MLTSFAAPRGGDPSLRNGRAVLRWTPTPATRCARLSEREALLRTEIHEHRERLLEADAADNNSFIAGSEGAMADEGDTLAIARLAHAQHELDLVVQALLRLDGGRYGACQRCGRPVGEARLRAAPEARLCLDCQQLVDRARPGH